MKVHIIKCYFLDSYHEWFHEKKGVKGKAKESESYQGAGEILERRPPSKVAKKRRILPPSPIKSGNMHILILNLRLHDSFTLFILITFYFTQAKKTSGICFSFFHQAGISNVIIN